MSMFLTVHAIAAEQAEVVELATMDEGIVGCGIRFSAVDRSRVAVFVTVQVAAVDPQRPLTLATAKSTYFEEPENIEVPIVAAFIENAKGKRLTIPLMVQAGAEGGLQYAEKFNDGAIAFVKSLMTAPVSIGATDNDGAVLSYTIAKTLSKSDRKTLLACLDDFSKFVDRD
jgi:hypothetical protein